MVQIDLKWAYSFGLDEIRKKYKRTWPLKSKLATGGGGGGGGQKI